MENSKQQKINTLKSEIKSMQEQSQQLINVAFQKRLSDLDEAIKSAEKYSIECHEKYLKEKDQEKIPELYSEFHWACRQERKLINTKKNHILRHKHNMTSGVVYKVLKQKMIELQELEKAH